MDKLLKAHILWDKEYTMPDISVDEVDDDDIDESEVVDGPEDKDTPDSESLKLSVVAEACLDSPISVESDLKNMGSKGLLTTEAKVKLLKLH